MERMGITGVAAITVIAWLLGEVAKASRLDNKWIPVLCGVLGMVLGIVALVTGMPDFPAEDFLTACAVGAVSGLTTVAVLPIFSKSNFSARFDPMASPSGEMWQVITTLLLSSSICLQAASKLLSIIDDNIYIFSSCISIQR